MAIYHLHVKNISRGEGRSAVAAAAYRSGQTLPNEIEERESRFGGRRDVVHAEIILPAGAPVWMADRSRLWNTVEAAERRKDARLAKEIEFALPRELPAGMWRQVARSMAAVYVARGHVVDLAVHDDGSGHNPHVHLMLTTRAILGDGFGGKLREADSLKFVTEARTAWAQIANAALAGSGSGVEIDPRSHVEVGILQRPGVHRGPDRVERKARRAGRSEMTDERERRVGDPTSLEDDQRYPVPDPDGEPISPSELDAAEKAMLAEIEMECDELEQPPIEPESQLEERAGARAAVEELNVTPMGEAAADAYRLAPPDRDWWKSRSTAPKPTPPRPSSPSPQDWWRRARDDEAEQPRDPERDRWER